MGNLGGAGAWKSVGSRKFSTIKISPKSGNESLLALDFSSLTHLERPDGQLYKLRTWFSCEKTLICIYNYFFTSDTAFWLLSREEVRQRGKGFLLACKWAGSLEIIILRHSLTLLTYFFRYFFQIKVLQNQLQSFRALKPWV